MIKRIILIILIIVIIIILWIILKIKIVFITKRSNLVIFNSNRKTFLITKIIIIISGIKSIITIIISLYILIICKFKISRKIIIKIISIYLI